MDERERDRPGQESGQYQSEQEQVSEMAAIQPKVRGGKPIRVRKPSPVCKTHHVQMYVGCTGPEIRYFYCPIAGCTESKAELRS